MHGFAPDRRELAVFGLVGAGLLLTWAWGVSVRLPEEADFAWKLAVNGPRLLLAAAVGVGLAVSGVVGRAGATASRREVYTLAVSFGMAFGATRGLSADLFGPEADVVLGAAAGAIVFVGEGGLPARSTHRALRERSPRLAPGGSNGVVSPRQRCACRISAVAPPGEPVHVC